ncbi:hypothetical protein SEA_OCTOBIEN14_76 [Gordonia phage Octobien14]|uniref:Uncharacterized protein n=1 Tax=Gordonia phage Octobien14 TaxID=2483673 RepID=A0A3G3M9Z4_9CAUD|nr:hypothetical protein L3Y22_gp076 [Gordonia phage Octobien14]AYR03281.1 hypothetical protein SEA_OCTOBIEN14_76 [Gordonia phage Octobien14]
MAHDGLLSDGDSVAPQGKPLLGDSRGHSSPVVNVGAVRKGHAHW